MFIYHETHVVIFRFFGKFGKASFIDSPDLGSRKGTFPVRLKLTFKALSNFSIHLPLHMESVQGSYSKILPFRALKTKHDTPKYGLIYHASLVGQTNPKNKGKVGWFTFHSCFITVFLV